jgi:hypothetical protein
VPDLKLVLVSVAQLVGAGRVTSLPAVSPVIGVLMRLLSEMPAGLQLAAIVILSAGLLVALCARRRRAGQIDRDHVAAVTRQPRAIT